MAKSTNIEQTVVTPGPYLKLPERVYDLNLTDAFLKRPKFDDTRFNGLTDLTSVTIKGGSAIRATFVKIIAEGSHWQGIKMPNVQLQNAEFQSATLENCTLTHANVTGIEAPRAMFTDCDFSGSIARYAKLMYATFAGSKSSLRNVDASCANLTGMDFGDTDVRGMIVACATLTDAKLSAEQLVTMRGWEHNDTIDPGLKTHALALKAAAREQGRVLGR